MSTADSNETNTILGLIEQNFALQKSLVEIIKARDANEAEYRTNELMRDEKESERRADEAKAQEDYYKSLAAVLVPLLIPVVQSVLGSGPKGTGPASGAEQH